MSLDFGAYRSEGPLPPGGRFPGDHGTGYQPPRGGSRSGLCRRLSAVARSGRPVESGATTPDAGCIPRRRRGQRPECGVSRHGAICRIAAPWRSRFGLEAIVSRSSEWAWVGGAVALVALRPTGGPTSGGPAIATDRAIIPGGGGWHPAWSTWSPRPPRRSVSTADASSSHPARVGVSLSRSTARPDIDRVPQRPLHHRSSEPVFWPTLRYPRLGRRWFPLGWLWRLEQRSWRVLDGIGRLGRSVCSPLS